MKVVRNKDPAGGVLLVCVFLFFVFFFAGEGWGQGGWVGMGWFTPHCKIFDGLSCET